MPDPRIGLPVPRLTATIVDGEVVIAGVRGKQPREPRTCSHCTSAKHDIRRCPELPPAIPKPARDERFVGVRAPGAGKRTTSAQTAAAFRASFEARKERTDG